MAIERMVTERMATKQMTGKQVKQYDNPVHFKTALEQRIRNQAKAGGSTIDRIRQFIIYDRFVTRLRHTLGDGFVLKGGFVLELRLAQARTTRDVDLTLFGDPTSLLFRLQTAAHLDLEDFFSFDVSSHPRGATLGAPDLPYQGERYRCVCHLAGRIYGNAFGLDIAFAAPFAGQAEFIDGSDALAFIGIDPMPYRVIPREAHLAEKLHAYSYPRTPDKPNSRIKDLPDIALLATTAPLSAARLRTAIRFTFERRASHPIPSSLADPPAEWERRYPVMADENRLRWQTLDAVISAARAFIDPILDTQHDMHSDATWNPETWTWIPVPSDAIIRETP